jgi:transposase
MTKKTSNRYSPEVQERAVRMVLEHGSDHASQWAAIASIASKIGCTGETRGSGCGRPSVAPPRRLRTA